MPLLPSYMLLQAYSFALVGSAYLLVYSPLAILNASPLWLLGESMHIRPASFIPGPASLGTNPSTSAPDVTLRGKRSIVQTIFGDADFLPVEIREVFALLGLVLFLAALTQGVLASPLRYSRGGLLKLANQTRGRGVKGAASTEDDIDVNALSEFAGKVHTLATAQTLFLVIAALRVMVEGLLVACVYLLYSDRSHVVGMKVDTARDGDGVFALLANRVVFTVGMSDMLFWGYIWTVVREEARDVAEVLALRHQMLEEEREGGFE